VLAINSAAPTFHQILANGGAGLATDEQWEVFLYQWADAVRPIGNTHRYGPTNSGAMY
jgi:hypothetical protein